LATFTTFGLRDLDLGLGSGHTAYRSVSLIDLYLYLYLRAIFRSNRENFLWTDGRTYGHWDRLYWVTRRSWPKY